MMHIKSVFIGLLCFLAFYTPTWAQAHFFKGDELYVQSNYRRTDTLITMRDGVKLFTIIYAPQAPGNYPIIINRTPYGIGPYESHRMKPRLGPSFAFTQEKFIFVYQDVRGTGLSEGLFRHVRPMGEGAADEATDFYDSAEWLLKKSGVNHNGRLGIWGLSYGGFYALCALASAHPALQAVAPEAPVVNWGRGDDFVQNGVFYYAHAFQFFSWFNRNRVKDVPMADAHRPVRFPPNVSAAQFYTQLGTPEEVRQKHLPDVPFWDTLLYERELNFWDKRDPLFHIHRCNAAVLLTGGWFDFENISGTVRAAMHFDSLCAAGKFTWVMGPWTHGGWWTGMGDSLAGYAFGTPTASYFRDSVQLPFFINHLKAGNEKPLPRKILYRTGINKFETEHDSVLYPKKSSATLHYLPHTGMLSTIPGKYFFIKGLTIKYARSAPVPYSQDTLPEISADFIFENQLPLHSRKDVIVMKSEVLKKDFCHSGYVQLHLNPQSSWPDYDLIFKLLDCNAEECRPVSMAVRRYMSDEEFSGKIHFSFFNHCWKKGHYPALQIQNSAFPLIPLHPYGAPNGQIQFKLAGDYLKFIRF